MREVKHPKGFRWEVFKQLVFRTYGDTCLVKGSVVAGGPGKLIRNSYHGRFDSCLEIGEHAPIAWKSR